MSVDSKLSYESYDRRFWGQPSRTSQCCEQLLWSEDIGQFHSYLQARAHPRSQTAASRCSTLQKSSEEKKREKTWEKHLSCSLAHINNQCTPRCCNSADLSLPPSMISHVRLRAAAPLCYQPSPALFSGAMTQNGFHYRSKQVILSSFYLFLKDPGILGIIKSSSSNAGVCNLFLERLVPFQAPWKISMCQYNQVAEITYYLLIWTERFRGCWTSTDFPIK